jgi:hypothetical protein
MQARAARLLCWLVTLAIPTGVLAQVNPNTHYAPPEATFTADNQLQIFQTEIDHKEFTDAAQRLEDLLRNANQRIAIAARTCDGSP